ncbi:PorT family protein [Pontibacter sp. HSC-14F20]|uniref:PorT family protein n=1 Tax=Pontibacter sp. HSC-14F20 TaxID=2864136 RepID=UPI001C738028|nr:PorT family protein [Pontibacter sp. HSC-14F20]MBX0333805.1 PorT family protein [Pontibacter sp. HSC-14F20]
MKNLYKLIMLCISALLSAPAAAQSDYRPGYVVMPQGDTLQGHVSYRTDALGKTVGFKRDNQSITTSYTANEISGYGFPGDRNYRTRTLDHADTLAAEYVFMQELVRGTASLFVYKNTFFIEKNDNPDKLHKLYITKETYVNTYGVTAQRDINHYVRTLNTLLQDCFAMFNKIERVKLAEKNLVDLVREYNKCVGRADEQIIFKVSKKWFAIRPGFVGALSHTSLNFSATDERYLPLEHAEFNTNTHPTFGLALLLNSPRINERASILVEGRYFSNSYRSDPSYIWFESYYDNEIEIELSALKLTTALRYDFAGKTLQPFVNAGGFLNFFNKRDFRHIQYVRSTQSSTPTERNRDNAEFLSKMQQGLMLGAGSYLHINKHRLSLEARYELGLDLHKHNAVNKINTALDSDTRSVSLLFGFYF